MVRRSLEALRDRFRGQGDDAWKTLKDIIVEGLDVCGTLRNMAVRRMGDGTVRAADERVTLLVLRCIACIEDWVAADGQGVIATPEGV